MFTGLVSAKGLVQSAQEAGDLVRLTIAAPYEALELGESIAVDGTCLTVTRVGDGSFAADVSDETLKRTTLGGLTQGSRVNLERALRLGDRLGGHLVTGHVDGTAKLARVEPHGETRRLRFEIAPALARYVAEKGSVCLGGVSLTVNGVGPTWFDVTIIPHTLEETTIGEWKTGDPINVEIDIVARYVERLGSFPGAADASSNAAWLERLGRKGYLD